MKILSLLGLTIFLLLFVVKAFFYAGKIYDPKVKGLSELKLTDKKKAYDQLEEYYLKKDQIQNNKLEKIESVNDHENRNLIDENLNNHFDEEKIEYEKLGPMEFRDESGQII